MHNITVIYFLIKVMGALQGGGEWRGTSFQPDGSSGDYMTPTFALNYRFFSKNRVTRDTIAN